jgi:hypothetical protein
MSQALPCPAAPPARLRGAALEPRGRSLPQVLPRVLKVQEARDIGRKADVLEIGLVAIESPEISFSRLAMPQRTGSLHEWRAIQGG